MFAIREITKTVMETDTGKLVENMKMNETIIVNELGKNNSKS